MDLEAVAHLDVCRLITTGRLTGRPHDIEMWFGVMGETVCMIAESGLGADWYRNALADPTVKLRFGGRTATGVARAATEGEERRRVGEAMALKYGDGDPEIGLEDDDWTWRVPALIVGSLQW